MTLGGISNVLVYKTSRSTLETTQAPQTAAFKMLKKFNQYPSKAKHCKFKESGAPNVQY